MKKEFDDYFRELKEFCEVEQYKGYDPFDGLNSKLFKHFDFLNNSRLFKLIWLQAFKRSPINFRKVAGIKKEYNPKGLGLFLSGYCILYKQDPNVVYLEKIKLLIKEIENCKSIGYSGICWGYNFDWQARAFFQPKGTPSIVVTSFIACALLDAYEVTKEERLLTMARSACDFVLNDLNRTYDNEGDFAFSYCPVDNTQIFNASLLGVRLLCRVYQYTKEEILLSESEKAVSYVCKHQQRDGAWTYSPLPFHAWIDNFHTGYNLECIYTFQKISENNKFKSNIENGLNYYLSTFFEADGTPKYYHNKKYPIDLHTTAQLIVTLSKMEIIEQHKDLVDKVLSWSCVNMFDNKRGYFYYYKEKYFTIKIPYIRWIQAWMFLGMSHYKTHFYDKKD